MATAFPLEDHIHCSVCVNIYTDPYSLSCLHTFCHQCILQLQKGTSIDCPECRENTSIHKIKKDFKTQTFLDWHFKQTEETTTGNKTNLQMKIPSKCELCNNETQLVHSKCIICDQFMCSNCVAIHKVTKISKYHTFQSIADIQKSIQDKLKQNIQCLEHEQEGVLKTSDKISVRIHDIQQSKLKQLADVKKYKEEIFTEIEEYCEDLNRIIVEVNDELIQNLTECDQHFNKALKEIQEKIDTLSKTMKIPDISLLSEKASSINTDVQNEIKEIKENLPNVDEEAKSGVEVNKHVEWNVSKTVSVAVDGTVYTSPNFKPKAEGSLFTEMLKHKYKQTKETQLSYSLYPHRLCLINDELWIAGREGIHIYNKDCQKIRDINDERIQGATRVVQAHNGDIIVSSYHTLQSGVHQIGLNGSYIQMIETGRFSDIATFRNRIYALSDLHQIIMYEESDKEWIQVKKIPLIFKDVDYYDSLCVKDTGIYVTSFNNHHLYYHNLFGEYLYKTGIKGDKVPGNFDTCRICDVDKLGNVLLADNGRNCLQLYSTDNKWEIVDLPVEALIDAVVDQHASNIWIITEEEELMELSLIKLTQV